MKRKNLCILIMVLVFATFVPNVVLADDERESREQERERERERDEDGSVMPYSEVILYVTIAAILAAFGYTAYRVYRTRELKKLQ